MAARVRMTKHQHLLICRKRNERPEWTYNELAEWACNGDRKGIADPPRHEPLRKVFIPRFLTLCTVLRNSGTLGYRARITFCLPKRPGKATILDIVKSEVNLSTLSADCLSKQRLRSRHMVRLDEAVAELVIEAELSKTPISGREVIRVSARLASELRIPQHCRPRFTIAGWLRHFLARHNFRHKRTHDEIGSVNVEEALKHVAQLRERIGQFHPQNVYNMDETALYYKAVPRSSVCLKEAPALKFNKARVTMAVGANADGSDKLPLIFLGKAECPRWLSEKPADVQYVGTSKGWMTAAVYQQWALDFNGIMQQEERQVLLIVDNAPSHIHRGVSLSNVTVLKLPLNTTSLLQPMDQGVIANLKREYMNMKTEVAVERFLDGDKDPYRISLIEGIELCQESWTSTQADAIKNCWAHAKLFVDRSQIHSILNRTIVT